MNDIEHYLRENKPETPAEGQFLIETSARLNAVEGIRQEVVRSRRRGRIALVIALAAGLVLGCLATAVVLLYPVEPLRAEQTFLTGFVATLQGAKEYLFGLIAACALALGLLAVTRKKEAI